MVRIAFGTRPFLHIRWKIRYRTAVKDSQTLITCEQDSPCDLKKFKWYHEALAETKRLRAVQRPTILHRMTETGIESKKLRLVRSLIQKEEYDSDEEDSSSRRKDQIGTTRRKVIRKARSRDMEDWEVQIDREKRRKEKMERLQLDWRKRMEQKQEVEVEEVYDLQWIKNHWVGQDHKTQENISDG